MLENVAQEPCADGNGEFLLELFLLFQLLFFFVSPPSRFPKELAAGVPTPPPATYSLLLSLLGAVQGRRGSSPPRRLTS